MADLRDRLATFRYSVFRLETLQVYAGSSEDPARAAFQRGDPTPPPDPDQDQWVTMLRAHRDAGRTQQRVHVVREPVSDYLAFELTWEYGPHAAAGEDIKRQELLYGPGRHVQIVLGEAALTMHFGAVDTLLGQLDRLVTLAGLASVDLRVLPRAVASPVMPLSGFWLDEDAVYIETLTGEQQLTGPDDIAVYTKAFELLHIAALAGQDAAALIQRVAAELRA